MRSRQKLAVVIAVSLAVIVSARLTLHADDAPTGRPLVEHASKTVKAENSTLAPKVSVQDSLQKPLALPFGEPTSLAEVALYLGKALNAPVVLDVAALKRRDITADEKVQLELQGVRLQTGLKLLLDQVGLTYRIVPEDNLLIFTDTQGSDDPLDRVFSELKSLHRDIHDLQDTVDDLRSAIGLGDEGSPRMRKPTIIEEMPDEPAKKPASPPGTSPTKPRS